MKRKTRPIPKGRAVDAKALARVQDLLGDAPHQRDLLIEHLHKLNDHFGYLPAAELAGLAQEMRLPLAEVYEVATFYHHFEVVKEPKDLYILAINGEENVFEAHLTGAACPGDKYMFSVKKLTHISLVIKMI